MEGNRKSLRKFFEVKRRAKKGGAEISENEIQEIKEIYASFPEQKKRHNKPLGKVTLIRIT